MKANENLMVGDWVKFKGSDLYHQVKVVSNKSIKFDNQKWFAKSSVEPIPLTPEILKKNGFKPYIPEYHFETVYACQDVSNAVADELYALWPYQDGSFYLLLRVDGKDMVRIDVRYVHQLQHALRLCGIKKEEIVL